MGRIKTIERCHTCNARLNNRTEFCYCKKCIDKLRKHLGNYGRGILVFKNEDHIFEFPLEISLS